MNTYLQKQTDEEMKSKRLGCDSDNTTPAFGVRASARCHLDFDFRRYSQSMEHSLLASDMIKTNVANKHSLEFFIALVCEKEFRAECATSPVVGGYDL